jgi:hypothetical protein
MMMDLYEFACKFDATIGGFNWWSWEKRIGPE